MEPRNVGSLPQIDVYGGNSWGGGGMGFRPGGSFGSPGGTLSGDTLWRAHNAMLTELFRRSQAEKKRLNEMQAVRVAEEAAAAQQAAQDLANLQEIERRRREDEEKSICSDSRRIAEEKQKQVDFILGQLKLPDDNALIVENQLLLARFGTFDAVDVKACRVLLESVKALSLSLDQLYLRSFYTEFDKFPVASKDAATAAVAEVGATYLHNGLHSTGEVEILISDGIIGSPGSQFGHVAVDIGGIVYGRAPSAWDMRSKDRYIRSQEEHRSTVGYVLTLNNEQKMDLLASVNKKIVADARYSVLNHSCSGEIVSSFGDVKVNVVDPRWTIGGVFSPADIDNFLRHSNSVTRIEKYPQR